MYATGDTGNEDAVVIDYSGSDIRNAAKYQATAPTGLTGLGETTFKNSDGNTITAIRGFNSNQLRLINSSGKIQGAVSDKKDGDDWYWYSTGKDGVTMYTSEKDRKGTDLAGNGWK